MYFLLNFPQNLNQMIDEGDFAANSLPQIAVCRVQ